MITIEDGCIIGGFGEAIASLAAESKTRARVLNIGWPDKFIEHGSINELRAKYGLNAESIARKAEDFIENKA